MNGFRGGFGGGNMQNIMRQAQKMKEDMERAEQELAQTMVEGTAGGGMVKVSMNGKKENFSISLKREAVDPDDIEMLEDLIASAMKTATDKSKSEMEAKMKSVTGGVNIPGLTL